MLMVRCGKVEVNLVWRPAPSKGKIQIFFICLFSILSYIKKRQDSDSKKLKLSEITNHKSCADEPVLTVFDT